MTHCKKILMPTVFIFLLTAVGASALAADESLRNEIYANITGGCEGKPLSRERCYKAQTTKAFVDVLINKGSVADEIYMKVVQRYSSSAILDSEIRERIRLLVAADVKKPKPRMAIETFNLHFGPVSQYSVRIAGKVGIFNKGKADLIVTAINPSCECLSVSLAGAFSATEEGSLLAPGQSGEISVLLELQHPQVSVGPLRESVTMTSNDPRYPQARIIIDAEVNQDPVPVDEKQQKEQADQERKLRRFRSIDRLPRSR